MKVIKYKFLSARVNHRSEESPDYEDILLEAKLICDDALLEANEGIVKLVAYEGEYTVEEATEDEVVDPAPEERITELEEALALLLSGVTE